MRPTRTADDLIGKRLMVRYDCFISIGKVCACCGVSLRRWSMHEHTGREITECMVKGVKTNKDGKLVAVYVVKREPGTNKWRKTKKRLIVEDFDKEIHRYRGEGQERFTWITDAKIRMARNQRGCNSRDFQAPTIAWWLNNPEVIEQRVKRPRIDHKDGRPRTTYLRDPKTGRLPDGSMAPTFPPIGHQEYLRHKAKSKKR